LNNDKNNDEEEEYQSKEIKQKLKNNLMFYGNLKNTIQLKQKEKLTLSSSVGALGLETLERELQFREKSSTKLLNNQLQTKTSQNFTKDTDENLPSPIKQKLDERVMKHTKYIEKVSSQEQVKIRISINQDEDIE